MRRLLHPGDSDPLHDHVCTYHTFLDRLVEASNKYKEELEALALTNTNAYAWGRIEDDLLLYHYDSVVIPTAAVDIIKDILILAHNKMAHGGVSSTVQRIKGVKVYWVHMQADITKYINACDECQVSRTPVSLQNNTNLTINVHTEVLGYWQVDLITPLLAGKTTYGTTVTALVGFIDLASRYAIFEPIASTKATDVVEAYVRCIEKVHGVPKLIYCDNGTHFKGEFEKYLADRKIPQRFASSLHHQSVGAIERVNGTILNRIRSYTTHTKDANKWPLFVRDAVFAYNTSFHRGIGAAPYEIIHGKKANTPLQEEVGGVGNDTALHPSTAEHHIQFINDIRELSYITSSLYLLRVKQEYDKRVTPHVFKVGDYVLKSRENRPNKFTGMYHGPYKVMAVNGSSYTIKLVLYNAIYDRLPPEDLSGRRLIPYDNSATSDEMIHRRRLEEGEDLVESVTEHRIKAGTVDELEFNVNWKTINGITSSWEPKDNIKGLVRYQVYVEANADTITKDGKSKVKNNITDGMLPPSNKRGRRK